MAPPLTSRSWLARASQSRWTTPGCLVIYLALACLIFWPASPWNDSRLPSVPYGGFGYGDPAQTSWFLGWTAYALVHGLNPLHTSFLDFPSGANVASNTSTPLLAVLATPVSLTLGPVAAFNVLLRLAFATSAASMFFVLKTWCRWTVSFIGGLFYGFGPYLVAQSTHLNLAFVPLPPLIVWVLYDLAHRRKYRASVMGVALGLLVGAQVLIDPEPLVLLGAVVIPGLVAWYVLERQRLRPLLGHLACALPWTVVIAAVLDVYYLWWMLAGPTHVSGPPQLASSLQRLSSDLLTPIVPTLSQMVLPRALVAVASRFVGGNFTENCGYLGIGLIAWVIAVAWRYRDSRIIRYCSLAALWGFALSLGRTLTIDAHPTHIPLPDALLAHLPFFDYVVPSRFALPVALFVVIAAAVGAERFLRELGSRTARARRIEEMALVALAVLAVVLELPQVSLTTKPPGWPRGLSSALATVPSGAVVLAYPLPVGIYTDAMSWQAGDDFRFRLIGGYINVPGPFHHGQYFAYPLAPHAVESYLTYAQAGTPAPYPAVSVATPPTSALCTFVRRHDVGAVLYLRQGWNPTLAHTLFSEALGRPSVSIDHGRFEVWLSPGHRCGGTRRG